MKKARVIRIGAIGDSVFVTPLLKQLKKDGYHITFYGSKIAHDVLRYNPNVDKWIIHNHDNKMTNAELFEMWDKTSNEYDKDINLSMSIEQTLLKEENTDAFYWSHNKRHEECNVNYQDRTMAIGGYPNMIGETGELHLSSFEESQARQFKKKHKGKFIILWALSGSSFHKAYPYAEFIMKGLVSKYKDILILNVGDSFCEVLDIPHEYQIKNYAGKWSIRKTMAMTKYADLVVGSETGVLNFASCFETPKIIFLSHSSDENLTKYWVNATVFKPNVPCYPCHRLIYTLDACPTDKIFNSPLCTTAIKPSDVFMKIESIYKNKNKLKEAE